MGSQNMELVAMIRARLLKDKAMAVPRVHVHASNGPRVAELQQAVQGLKGELITRQGTPVCLGFPTTEGFCYILHCMKSVSRLPIDSLLSYFLWGASSSADKVRLVARLMASQRLITFQCPCWSTLLITESMLKRASSLDSEFILAV